MRHETGHLDGVGGLRVFRQAWLPDAAPRAVVVIAHGGGEHSGRYAWVAEQLVERGLAVHALDHRGHGRTGTGAYIDAIRNAAEDVGTLVEHARTDAPLFVLGHSFGGLIALDYALEHPDRIDGLVLSAPLAGFDVPGAQRVAVRVLSKVAPRAGIFQVPPEHTSRDPEMQRAYAEDPLNHHGKLPARSLWSAAETIDTLASRLPAFDRPLLVLHSRIDQLTPYDGGKMVHDLAGSPDKELVTYDELYHELLNEPEREQVLETVAAWVLARSAAPAASPGP